MVTDCARLVVLLDDESRRDGPYRVRLCTWLDGTSVQRADDMCVGYVPELGSAEVLVSNRLQRRELRHSHPRADSGRVAACPCECHSRGHVALHRPGLACAAGNDVHWHRSVCLLTLAVSLRQHRYRKQRNGILPMQRRLDRFTLQHQRGSAVLPRDVQHGAQVLPVRPAVGR